MRPRTLMSTSMYIPLTQRSGTTLWSLPPCVAQPQRPRAHPSPHSLIPCPVLSHSLSAPHLCNPAILAWVTVAAPVCGREQLAVSCWMIGRPPTTRSSQPCPPSHRPMSCRCSRQPHRIRRRRYRLPIHLSLRRCHRRRHHHRHCHPTHRRRRRPLRRRPWMRGTSRLFLTPCRRQAVSQQLLRANRSSCRLRHHRHHSLITPRRPTGRATAARAAARAG